MSSIANSSFRPAPLFRVAAVSLVLALGGCGADDVQFNGKIFDAIGMNSPSKGADPKLAARAPLVLPPSLERVPEPGKPPEGVPTDVLALKDPEAQAKLSRAELEKQQAAYCKVHYEDAKSRGDDTADLAEGPLGPCKGSVFTAIKNWNKSQDESEE